MNTNQSINNRRNLFILAATMIVIMLGFGMVIPVMPFYIDKLGASGSDLGWLVAVYALMQLIFAPIWGAISDRVGRKPVLMVGIVGYAIFLILFGLATRLWMLFLARSLAGILSSATYPSMMAFISDSTAPEERGDGMGKLGAAMGVGVILGPGIGGWLAQESLSRPFFIAAALAVVTLGLVAFFLPESLPRDARQQTEVRTVNVKALWAALRSPLGVLLGMAFLLSFGLTSFEAIFGLYALEKFEYGPERVGTIMVVVALVSAVVQGILIGPLTKYWGEPFVIKLSLAGSVAGFLVMLLATTYPMILLTTGFFVLTVALLRPAVASLVSQHAEAGQGVAQGLNNSFMSLGRIVGPLLAGYLFDVNYNLPFISGAVIMLIGFFIALAWIQQEEITQPVPQIVDQV
ncbi:MAG: MFS transporter [Ardenticatenaceae bacterium]|nr:MFS transporter [Ardenticatenaceae bacterium]